MSLSELTQEAETAEEREKVLDSLISQYAPANDLDGEHFDDSDSGVFHALSLLRRALILDVLKENSCRAIFNLEKPFYSENLSVLGIRVGGKAYYLAKTGKNGDYKIKTRSFFGREEQLDIFDDCEGMDELE